MGSLVELLSPKLISDMDTVVSELIKGICSLATAKPVPGLTGMALLLISVPGSWHGPRSANVYMYNGCF